MKSRTFISTPRESLPIAGLLAVLVPHSASACAACYGQSDSAMAAGMNWGILSLLGMIIFVLGGVAGFFVFLARRSASLAHRVAEPTSAGGLDLNESGETAQVVVTEPIFARGGFGRSSGLAQTRKSCASSHGHPGALPMPRGRN